MTTLAALNTSLLNCLQSSDQGDAVQAQVGAVSAPLLCEACRQAEAVIGKTASEVSDAFRWLTAGGPVADVSAVGLVLLPGAVLITTSCEFIQEDEHITMEHVPVSLTQSPALLAHQHQQSGPVQQLVSRWAEKYKTFSSENLKTLFAKIFGKTPIRLDTLKEKLVDPLERVLPQELKGPWLTWFAKRPQAIGELVNSLPAEQAWQADFGI